MKESRLPQGSSDPLSFTCTCSASSNPTGGLVLLFYRYFAASPPLATSLLPASDDPTSLATFHTIQTSKYHLGGKIRVAKEGFNITVGGTKNAIEAYIQDCISHWSFASLELDTEEKKRAFFKPTQGCACVFGKMPASVQVKTEITPMGVTNYVPKNWAIIETLSPKEFHERCWRDEGKVLIDVRNHYESKIGYFIDPRSGKKALAPEIRRFSQWPQYVKRKLNFGEVEGGERKEEGRQFMTYCTGGIRCEKGARFLAENMERREGDRVSTLHGGIAAYLMWMDEEIKEGRKTAQESLFRGRNYVFDARGSTALNEQVEVVPVSECQVCATPSDRLSKCRSRSCHLILVVCSTCEETMDPRCCENCLELDELAEGENASKGPRTICKCEKERELKLWGDKQLKSSRTQGPRNGEKEGVGNGINIQIKTID